MKTKWMKALAGGCAAVLMLPSMLASARTDDAVVFADFEGTGTPAVGQKLPGNEPGKEVWLNGTEDVIWDWATVLCACGRTTVR